MCCPAYCIGKIGTFLKSLILSIIIAFELIASNILNSPTSCALSKTEHTHLCSTRICEVTTSFLTEYYSYEYMIHLDFRYCIHSQIREYPI